jgi:hypothetical protein
MKKSLSYFFIYKPVYFIQQTPLNGITLGPRETEKTNILTTLTIYFGWLTVKFLEKLVIFPKC